MNTWPSSVMSSWPNASQPTTPQSPSQQLQQQLMSSSTMSPRTIAIGCGLFFFFFVVIVFVALIAALQNPTSLEWLNISPDMIKNVVKGIVILISLLFFFGGFGLAVWSGYRFFTKKEWSKVAYGVWLMLWVMIVLWAIVGGIVWFQQVDAMDGSWRTPSNVINPYLLVKQTNDRRVRDGRIYLQEPWLKIIAPAQIVFQFNQATFNRVAWSELRWQLQWVSLDCGNGQIVTSLGSDFFFSQPCLYLEKWSYTQSLTYRYRDATTQQIIEKNLSPLTTVLVHTAIRVTPRWGQLLLNDAKNEIVLGKNPIQVSLDASSIFTDLGLINSIINWDLDNDSQVDKTRTNFSHYFYDAKLHTISYEIPEYPGIVYQFPVRVEESNIPSCTVTSQLINWNQYRLGIQLADSGVSIDRYAFEIIDQSTDAIIDRIESDRSSTIYSFAPGRQYQVRWLFTTVDNEQWVCETDSLAVNNLSYLIRSSMSVRYANATSSEPLMMSGMEVRITSVPAQVELKIDEIVPAISRPDIVVTVNWSRINPTSQRTYLIGVDTRGNREVRITVTDEQGKMSTQEYIIVTDVSPIVGVLTVDKKVWFDPLTVKFDASISQLNDPDDEVVYFTWDFGDGEIVRNVSQWSIQHVYRFSDENESWAYRPKVTITTQKWFTDTIQLAEDIVVKRAIRTVRLTSTSHPAQRANLGDQVAFAVQVDGWVRSVSWDFGNDQTLREEWRQWLDAEMTYLQRGLYDIIVTVEFTDHPPVTQTMKLRVE